VLQIKRLLSHDKYEDGRAAMILAARRELLIHHGLERPESKPQLFGIRSLHL
jgi:hypothetical protein